MSVNSELTLEDIDGLYGEIRYDLATLESMEAMVQTEGKVDQITMESLSRMVPDAIRPQYPLASYSKAPSEQNLEASLEAFRIAKSIAVMSLGGVLGGVLRALVSLYKSDSLDTRCQHLLKLKEALIERQKDLTTWVKRIESIDSTTAAIVLGNEINAQRQLIGKGDVKDTSEKAKALVALVRPTGPVFKTFETWSRDVVKHSSLFSKRVRIVADVVDKAYSAKPATVSGLIEKLNTVELWPHHQAFCTAMTEAADAWCAAVGPDYEDNFADFVKHELADQKAFYELADRYETAMACSEVFSKANVQLNRNMDLIDDATLTLFGGVVPHQLKVGQMRSGEVQSLADGDETVKVTTRAVPTELLDAIQRADAVLRAEAEAFRCYRIYLERIVFFYQHVLAEYDQYSQEMINRLKRIESDAPVA